MSSPHQPHLGTQVLPAAARQVVEGETSWPASRNSVGDVRADEARAAGDQDLHGALSWPAPALSRQAGDPAEVRDGLLQSFLEVTLGSQPSNFRARVMSGWRCLRIVLGQRLVDDLPSPAGRRAHRLGELEDGHLLRVAEVHRVRSRPRAPAGRCRPPGPARSRRSGSALPSPKMVKSSPRSAWATKAGTTRPSFEAHPRPVGVEDADDARRRRRATGGRPMTIASA